MKKLAYITLIAAFVFGVQPQEAFSSESNTIEMAEAGAGSAKIVFDQSSETLHVLLSSRGKEKAQILVYLNGSTVAKETVLITGSETAVEINLEGLPRGSYSVKVVSPSIEFKENFRKK